MNKPIKPTDVGLDEDFDPTKGCCGDWMMAICHGCPAFNWEKYFAEKSANDE